MLGEDEISTIVSLPDACRPTIFVRKIVKSKRMIKGEVVFEGLFPHFLKLVERLFF